MTFLTLEMKDKIKKLDSKELDKIVHFIEKIKHSRKFSILESHGKPLINQHHFSNKKKKIEEKDPEDDLPPDTTELLRKLSMPDTLSENSVDEQSEHVFSTNAEVEWYYIVSGMDIVYPEQFCDVLESLFRKPGHTGRHQKQTPFVDGDDTCVVDLHLMRHTNQRTGKIYPLRRKVNPLYKPPVQEKNTIGKKSDSEGGASLPDDDASKKFISSLLNQSMKTASSIASSPAATKATEQAKIGATKAAAGIGRMFTRTMTWLGSKRDIVDDEEEIEAKSEPIISAVPEKNGGAVLDEVDESEDQKEEEFMDKVIHDADVEPAEPRKRSEGAGNPGPVPDMRNQKVENLD